jgi:hypothetical protein
MGDYLQFIILPISRFAATGRWEITEARKIFGLDEWESLPEQVGMFRRFPGLKEIVDEVFEELFRTPKYLNINEFSLLGYHIKERYEEKTGCLIPKEWNPQPLTPFRRGGFVTTVYGLVYSGVIEPKLAIRLLSTYKGEYWNEGVIPYEINGVKIDGGDLMYPTMIPLSTLQKTDLDEFQKSISIELTKDRFLANHAYALDEVMAAIKEAKRKECDFFAYIG